MIYGEDRTEPAKPIDLTKVEDETDVPNVVPTEDASDTVAAAGGKVRTPQALDAAAKTAAHSGAALQRPAWAASADAAPAAAMLPDTALVAAYLRRLGFSTKDAVDLSSREPFKGAATTSKTLLCDLLQQHLLCIPFENLELHQHAPAGSPAPSEACLRRLRDIRSTVAKIALGAGGGLSYDLNLAFAWLLQQLGASVRIAAARAANSGEYTPSAMHITILVDFPDGTFLVDPGFPDPPRVPIRIEGETADDLATYEVATLDEGHPAAGFERELRRARGTHSLCRHVDDPDNEALDQCEATATPIFAFRASDNLAFDAEEIRSGMLAALSPGGSPLAGHRVVCLALPKGHIMLTERLSRRVEGGTVIEEVQVDSRNTWQKLAGAILGRPLLTDQPKMGKALRTASVTSPKGDTAKSLDKQESVMSRAKRWGSMDNSSIAVGGAGAGGGMGLNKPGFGQRIQHFTGRASILDRAKSINIDEDIRKAWAQVMDDVDPMGWVYCEYSADGKMLELKSKGEGGLKAFKEQLGTTMGWGGFRCCGVDKRGGVECKRPKFIFVQYKPESAPAIKKAKQGSHKGDVKDSIMGAHIDVVVENAAQDLDEQALISKLQAATGAHKPNGYEFEEGIFLEADFYGLGIGKDCKGETSRN